MLLYLFVFVGSEMEEEDRGGVREHPHGPGPEQDGPAI